MKKLIIFISLILLMTGCSENKDNYLHYTLEGYDLTKTYQYPDSNNVVRKYVITDITEENSEEVVEGLFYQNGKNDYILLDKITNGNSKNS